ncbi:DUF4185 domain-containing protein [Mycobacterium deserti]|uniref:DUF4185 domain-containing protein n=1 Tax=Mycobacterium deserti TaxID=2978347 RepID=A0ABT2M913_9MYCO|nr:DUF4185 domain-containing protein [Mycobacterium deserti]MCT7658753.1 DUF4185 domain-containing protein [Mycobacterium deserti]
MGASAYIGRVGGLAVALGVGAAVATGHGVAWADETGSTSSTSESSASTSADTAPTGSQPASSAAATNNTAAQTAGADADADEVDADEDDGDENADEDEDTDEENADEENDDTDADADTDGGEDLGVDTGGDGVVDTGAGTEPPAAQPGDDNASSNGAPAQPAAPAARAVAAASTGEEDKAAQNLTAGDTQANAQRMAVDITPAVEQTQTLITTTQTAAVPVALAATQAPAAPQNLLQRVVVNVLSSLGIGQFVSKLPGAPVWSPIVMALLGLGARREFNEPPMSFARALAAVSTSSVLTYPATSRTPQYISANTHFIEFVTGAGNLNNTTTRFGIGGTDLGIMWDNGIADNPATPDVNEHQVLIAFGDTFSNGWPNVRTGVWRFNTLFRSADGTLSNGLYVPNGVPYDHFSGSPMERPNWSDPILPSPGQPVHSPYAIGPEVTIIPTAGISTPYNNAYGARQYMSFMSVRSWDTPGRWTTNYSGIAYSDDNGQTWRIAPTSIRTAAAGRATVPYVSGNQNFQQGAFVAPPAGSPEAAAGWVYAYGTPSGRAGTVYLSRVQQTQILDVSKYEYWNGSTWVANTPSAAKPLLPGTTTSFFFFKQTTYPAVSEMSVQYNPYLKKYVMLYGDSGGKIVMRTATSPEGTWSAPTTLVGASSMAGKYAPYIHPWSGSDNVPTAEQKYLYWNLSTWNDYQVRLMRTDLTKV